MEDIRYIDVGTTFKPILNTKNLFLGASDNVQAIVIRELEKSDLVLTYVDEFEEYKVGDLIEIPFGKMGKNIGIVEAVPSELGVKEGINYKPVIPNSRITSI